MTPAMFEERSFPTTRPVVPGLDYFGDWRTACRTNGDYLDYFEMSDGSLGLAVGDVGGGGASPTLLKSSLHSMIRALRYTRNFSLKALMRTVDKVFSEVCPDRSYATLFVAEYDPSTSRLHYVNAGHESPFVLRRNGKHFQTIFLEPGGPMIGMLRKTSYREGAISLKPGDLLVAYTDGLCETTNRSGEEWGWPRFLEAVEECADRRACDVVEGVLRKVEEFSDGAPPNDDMTLFVGRLQEAVADTPRWKTEWAGTPMAVAVAA